MMLLLAVVNIGFAVADNTSDLNRETDRVMSLIEHGKFTEARHSLALLSAKVPIDDEVLMRHIDFGLVRCAVELRDNEAEQMMLAFLRRYPESVHVNDVRFLLAMYYCEREEYNKARTYLDHVSYKALTTDNKERYNMRMGYIEFTTGNYDKAYELFSTLSPSGNYADHAV